MPVAIGFKGTNALMKGLPSAFLHGLSAEVESNELHLLILLLLSSFLCTCTS